MNSSTNLPLISVVIPNHNGAGYLAKCLRSLQAQTFRKHGNCDCGQRLAGRIRRDRAELSAPGAVLLRESRNLGFAGGVNAGIRSSHGEWIAVLNNDTEVQSNWLAECARRDSRSSGCCIFRLQDTGLCRSQPALQRGRLLSARRHRISARPGDARSGGLSARNAKSFRHRDARHSIAGKCWKKSADLTNAFSLTSKMWIWASDFRPRAIADIMCLEP